MYQLDRPRPAEAEGEEVMNEKKPSNECNGSFLDAQWCCKVCGSEILYGHTEDCDIWLIEKKHRAFIAKEYNDVLQERDKLAHDIAYLWPQRDEALKRAAQLKAALDGLVALKDWKDKHGKDMRYQRDQPVAWEKARAALAAKEPSE